MKRLQRGSFRRRPATMQGALAGRRGVALLVVLLLISMTLGLSYAAMRSQYSAAMIQRNSDRRASAQQAAVAGMTMAIKKMHTIGWAGVGTSISGSLGNSESYHVTYTAGDPSLNPKESLDVTYENSYPLLRPSYYERLYRVTLLSTGMAADPSNPSQEAMYQIQAVLSLSQKRLPKEPTDWAEMQNYTVYQTQEDEIKLEIPCWIEGPLRVQGKLDLGTQPDVPRLSGLVWLPHVPERPVWLKPICKEKLAQPVAADWTKPTGLATYRLYPGGPTYTVGSVGSVLEKDLAPDPVNNPLGIFYSDGRVTIRDHVTIQGSLFCKGDIHVEGTNVVFKPVAFEPVDAPLQYPDDAPVPPPVCLPTVSCQNFLVTRGGSGSVAGLVAVFEEFKVEDSLAKFEVTGRVITRKLHLKAGTIKRTEPSSPISYHWHNWNDPIDTDNAIYVRYDDAGLRYPDRWDLVRWTENPYTVR